MITRKTRKKCTRCENEFYGGHRRLYCDACRQLVYYTCQDCGKSKSYKYSRWCYPCSLKNRDMSNVSMDNAIEAARSPEANEKRRQSLLGHKVSNETRDKISKANTGKKHTAETKRKMSKDRKGVEKSDSFRESMSIRMKGKNNPFWKGGISDSPYASGWTERLKNKARKKDNYTCQDCGKIKIDSDGEKLQVHHLDFSKDNHNLSNLITLCKSCHSKRHNVIKNITGE